ncbi:MAG: hypothetical protein LBP34_05570 [Flavobacteriaceae bacterium]|jgi:hypothetical protein|nr:hypothetical protein [Flavobacteriaceae bacterium]
MKKQTLANFIAVFIGIYFIVRAYSWYTEKDGDIQQNKYFALAYFCVGVLAITIQLVVNYIKNKRKK